MWTPRPDPHRAAAYRAAGYWRDESIAQAIASRCDATPDAKAILDPRGRDLTYAELWAASAAVAGHLQAEGVRARDIVTVCLPNWWEFGVAAVAALRLGAVVNPVPPSYGRADLAHIVGTCQSAGVVFAGRFRSLDASAYMANLAAGLSRTPALLRVGDGGEDVGVPFEAALRHAPCVHDDPGAGDAPAAVLFTSGTEAKPKGAVHTHNTILFGERAFAFALAIGPADIGFMASPLGHTTGFLHGLIMTLTTGGAVSLLDVFQGAAAVAQMRAHRCTWTMGATPFLADSVDTLEAEGGHLPDLRYFLSGGAPIPETVVRRAAAVGLRALPVYGSTESPPHTLARPDGALELAWQTDGAALPGVETRIVTPEGYAAAIGEPGEEWSRGPNTFLGYLDDPELSRRALDADGWVHSGDLARRTPDGSIRIVGRLKEIIVRGGQNISVREVEDYLASHPAVRQVAVVGVPHDRLGETACAVVSLRPEAELTLREIVAFLEAKGVAKFKSPEALHIWPDLPTTPSGKIQKFVIRQRLAAVDAAPVIP